MNGNKAAGKPSSKGFTLVQMTDLAPNKELANDRFERQIWEATERYCGYCGSVETKSVPNSTPCCCRDWRRYFIDLMYAMVAGLGFKQILYKKSMA